MELNLIFNHRIFFAKIYFFEVILFLNIFLNIKTYYYGILFSKNNKRTSSLLIFDLKKINMNLHIFLHCHQ